MRRYLCIPLVLSLLLLSGAGCGREDEQCREELDVKNEHIARLQEGLQEMKVKVEQLQEVVRMKHEETELHRTAPALQDQRLADSQERYAALRQQYEQLVFDHEVLLRRYDAAQRKLRECESTP